MIRPFFVIGLLVAFLTLLPWSDAFSLSFRTAQSDDVRLARRILFQEKMNPLSVSKDRLLVAVKDDEVLGFGQIRPLGGGGAYSELASLYVLKPWRRQGVASQIIRELLERHDNVCKSDVCLLTLRPTAPLYESHGFILLDKPLEDMPSSFQMEYKAGSVLSAVLGNDLACMVRRRTDKHQT